MTHLDPISRTRVKELYEAKESYYYSRADDPKVLEKIKRKEVKIVKTLVDSEIKRIDFLLQPLAATQQRFDYTQTAITTSDKKRTEDKLKLDKEKERLQELLKTLESGKLKNRFFWEIDFAEVFVDGGFDIVIANPPYVRQEKIAPLDIPEEKITKELRAEYKAALVRNVTEQWRDEFKKDLKSDLYVYFYYLGLALLKPRGVFCFISSNSWLDVGFGANLQAFLLKNIEVKAIFDNHAKRSFAEASINTIIAVFTRPEEENLEDKRTRFVAFEKPFKEVITETNLRAIGSAEEKLKTDDFRCVPLTQGELWKEGLTEEETNQAEITGSEFIGNYTGNKWGGKYLRAPDIYFTILEKGKGKLVRLGDIAEVRRGFTTGANEFFYLPSKYFDIKAEGDYYRLIPKQDGLPEDIRIEKEFLKKVIKSSKESKTPYIDRNKLKRLLFLCDIEIDELKEKEAFRYVEWGETQRFNQVPSCKSRKYWWCLGKRRIADIIIPPGFGDIFRVFSNRFSKVYADKRLYEIYYDEADLLHYYLNCTLFPMFADAGSRIGLGDGLLDLTVEEFEDILVAKPDIFNSTTMGNKYLERDIGNVFTEAGIDPSKPIREQEPNPLPDRAKLDNTVFDELGLTEEERKEVYWAVCELVKQRLEKARGLKRG